MRQLRLVVLVSLLTIFSTLPASNALFFAPPQLPSELKLITVHTTTLNYTGPASQSFVFNVAAIDSLSLITTLNLNTNTALTNFSIQILQLNYLPSNIATPGGNLVFPSGKPLLYFYFNIDPALQSQLAQSEFELRVPSIELQFFTANPASIMIQKFLYSWTTETSYFNSTVVQAYYVQYYTYRVITESPLTLYAVTETQSKDLTPITILLLIVTVPLAILILSRRTRLKVET